MVVIYCCRNKKHKKAKINQITKINQQNDVTSGESDEISIYGLKQLRESIVVRNNNVEPAATLDSNSNNNSLGSSFISLPETTKYISNTPIYTSSF